LSLPKFVHGNFLVGGLSPPENQPRLASVFPTCSSVGSRRPLFLGDPLPQQIPSIVIVNPGQNRFPFWPPPVDMGAGPPAFLPSRAPETMLSGWRPLSRSHPPIPTPSLFPPLRTRSFSAKSPENFFLKDPPLERRLPRPHSPERWSPHIISVM